MSEIIFHHFQRSPFSEKVRLAFGFKKAAWRSVEIPVIAPKPDLIPLTGGYRKTPVMQIGADVFCDTRIILRELDRRFPEQPLYSAGGGELMAAWADYSLFVNAVGVVMGAFAERMPKELKSDRAEMTNGLFDAERFKNEQPELRASLRASLAMIEATLRDGRSFVTGAAPSIADFALYHPLWFIRANFKDIDFFLGNAATIAWYERMTAFGHATSTPIDATEALQIAKASEPEVLETEPAEDMSGCKLGERVRVAASDYGRDPIEGDLVALDDTRIVIHRHDKDVGNVNVHFPRMGFDVAQI